tara:strand:+ start:1758 stop:2606 length:849 start_codon:yes stop_codon:yes gene_type:complete
MSSDRNYCDTFIDENLNNRKGYSFEDRFTDILSDPNNLLIPRCDKAGEVEGENVILHNGLRVSRTGYYGDFSQCLVRNYGCHEPAEERMFAEVLKDIDPGATMIELGSYWAFYSMWFGKEISNAKLYCIEPEKENLEVGKRNCELNNIKADFTQGYIGTNQLTVTQFIKDKSIDYIDMLHSDIQGLELEMLADIKPLLKHKQIKYLFVSTHSQDIHIKAREAILECDYRIIADADFDFKTFCMDGIIIACHKDNLTITDTSLGDRSKTPLRKVPYENLPKRP